MGSGQIPLNIELKQNDYTVCCSHTVVVHEDEARQAVHEVEARLVLCEDNNRIVPRENRLDMLYMTMRLD